MKKVLLVLLFLVMLGAGAGVSIFFVMKYNTEVKENETLLHQVAELQAAQTAIGEMTHTWTVKGNVTAGMVIAAEDLVQKSEPVSNVNDNTVMETEQIIGKYWKVDILPGTTITSSLVMEEEVTEAMYERDISMNVLPLGIAVGDYIDIRIVLPYGEEFVVVKHKRIEQVVLQSNTVKVHLSEAELALWTSALRDKALYGEIGLELYVTKYTEPGLMDNVIPFYPVRKEMESIVALNPNIANKKECVNSELRDAIELMLQTVTEEDGERLANGLTNENEKGNEAAGIVKERNDAIANGEVLNDYQAELDEAAKGILDGAVNDDSSVTQDQEQQADGDQLYQGEAPIE